MKMVQSRESARNAWNAWYSRQPPSYKNKIALQSAERRRGAREAIWRFKESHPCGCGEAHPSCLELHHTENKIENIGNLPTRGWSLDRVMVEIAKCVVLCANCHRRLHWELRKNISANYPKPTPAR